MKDDIVVDKSPLIEQYLPRKPNASSSKGRSNDQGESKPEPTRKQVLLQHNLELRKKFESMVLQWQEILCDPVDEDTLGEAANRIKQSHYQEVIEERNIVNLCGYPLCSRPPRDMKGKFRISLQERKVYDITILKKYCSSTCLSASRWIEAQMTEEPIYLNNADPEDLKIVRVSIVPLNMELDEFQAQRERNAPPEDTTTTPAYSLPEHDFESNSASTTAPQDAAFSTPAPTSSLGNEYVQSLLASIPKAPSFVKIVEHDTTGSTPRAPSHDDYMENGFGTIEDDSDDDFGQHQHDTVEGFRVPVNTDVDRIEYEMSHISLSDRLQPQDQPMHRSESSTSMDTQP
ncbi:RNA polymerase II associated protein 2 [Mortierella sp. GBA43]|nr:RNA polymerase II associated protein 2 [Mortierella sp. GBA43]